MLFPDIYCEKNCFGVKDKLCQVLAEPITDKECPFYKSEQRVIVETLALARHDIKAYRRAAIYDDIEFK